MLFRKNIHSHQWQKNKKISLFEERFIYANQASTAEVQRNDHNLPDEYVKGQDILENRARQIDAEVNARKKRGRARRILAGVFRKGEESIDELKIKRDVCGTKLDLLKAPIQNTEDFQVALEDIGSFNRSLSVLRTSELDDASLSDLTSTGLGSFLNTRLRDRLEYSKSKMQARQMLHNALLLSKSEPQLTNQAREDWEEHKALLQEQLRITDNLGERRSIKADLNNQTNWINQRVAEIKAQQRIEAEDAVAPAEFLDSDNGRWLREQNPNLYDHILHLKNDNGEIDELRLRRATREIEADQQKINLNSFLNQDDKLELNSILLEAREMRESRIRKYLEGQFNTTKEKLIAVQSKQPPRFNDIELRQFVEIFDFFEGGILQQAQLLREGGTIEIPSYGDTTETFACGPDAAKKLLDGLQFAQASIDGLDERYDEFDEEMNKDPEYFKDQIRQKFQSLEEATAAFTPERIDELLAKLEEPYFKERDDYEEKKAGLEALKGDDNALNQAMNETRAKVANLDHLSLSELAGISGSLTEMGRMLASFSGEQIDTALSPDKVKEIGSAKIILTEVSQLDDPVKIRAVLEANLESENLDFVNANKFENYPDPVTGNPKNLKDYTSEGGMVFYESADKKKWKIIVRWPVDKTDIATFKEQIMHETRHMLFENDPKTRQKWHKACVENHQWQDIKNAFITAVQPKKPPTGDIWGDDEVMGEMYAIGDPIFEGSGKFENLGKLMTTSGAADAILGTKMPKIKDGKVVEDGSYHGFENPGDAQSIIDKDPGATLKNMDSGNESEDDDSEGLGASASMNKEKIDINKEEIDRMLKSNYLGFVPGSKPLLKLLKDYNNVTEDLNKSYAETNSKYLSLEIKDRIELVEKELVGINREMAEAGDYMPHETMDPIRNLWNHTTFLALDDIIAVGSNIKEWWERRHKRHIDNNAAKVGSALFDKLGIPIIGEFGQEAEARKEKAEQEEVNEWQNRWESKDAWELIKIMEGMAGEIDPNKDALKAVLRLLAKKGRLEWRNEKLWEILNRLQDSASLMPGDVTLLKNPILLRQRLHQAIGEIWDFDEYLSLEKDNQSSWDSNIQKYESSLDKIQDQLTERMDQLLKKHRNGEKVDPMEYEGIMEYSIKKGKSSAEAVFFHLIAGMAYGLLPSDRGLALDKHLNAYPSSQWIYSKKPPLTRADYIRIGKTKFKDSFERGSISHSGNSDFMNFFWTEVQNDPMTIQRVRKSVSERSWDHDWGRSIACLGDANTAKRFLSGRSGQQEVKDTAVENAYVGALMWLENNASTPHKIDARKEFARQMSWVAMADGILDDVAFEGENFTRAGAGILHAEPREGPLSGHTGWKTIQFRNKIRDFLDRFDRPLFEMLRDQKAAKEDKKAHGQRVKNYLIERYPSLASEVDSVQSINDIFSKMDAIMGVIVNKIPPTEFNEALASIAK